MKSLLKAYDMTGKTAAVGGGQGPAVAGFQGRQPFTPQEILKSLANRLASLLMFRLRLVPLVIFFAVLVLGARVTTLFTHVGQGDVFKKAHASPTEKKKHKPSLQIGCTTICTCDIHKSAHNTCSKKTHETCNNCVFKFYNI